jgi:eukaryotic-like serine/threonine-protein kinase
MLRPFLFIFGTIIVLFTLLSASCRGNTLPPAPAEPAEARATVTANLASPTSITPAGPTEVSSAVQITPTHPANTPLPAATSPPGPACTQIGPTWISPVDGVTLVCVPAGEFLMGATDNDPQAQDNEKPQHRVYLDAFWIDRIEVTNANFAKCMADGACRPEIYEVSASTYIPYAVHPDYQDFPALLYEAEAAAAYCQWASRRLPLEAEWEKAARGTEVRAYPWGNDLDCTKANYAECHPVAKGEDTPRCGSTPHCRTSRVDDYPAGATFYGALNMAGNVWEWVADWYAPDYYAHSPTRNPTGPQEGDFRVRRGGGSKSRTQELRVTTRASGTPQHYFDGQMGFRCAASAFRP